MITFEAISKIVREERGKTNLASLPEGFIDDVRSYLSKKEQMDPQELNTAKSELKRLFELREKKILNMSHYFVRSGVIPGNMTSVERSFFNNAVNNIKEFQSARKKSLEGEEKINVIAFLEDLKEFVGINMKNYGPFKKGDVATLPEENAKLLIEKGLAKKMDIDSSEKANL